MGELVTLEGTLQNLVDTARREHRTDLEEPFYILATDQAEDVEEPRYARGFSVVVTFSYNWHDEDGMPRTSQMVYGLLYTGQWACWMD